MFERRHAVGALCLLVSALVPAVAQTPARSVAASLSQLVTGPEGYRVLPIGLTAGARGITALEPSLPVLATQPRIVIVGGLDGAADGRRVVLDLVSWRLGDATIVRNRRRWQVAAVPCALPDQCDPVNGTTATPAGSSPAVPPDKGFYDAPDHREARYLWRWITMLAPDLVIEVRRGDTLAWRANALAKGRVTGSADASSTSLAGALGTGAPGGLAPVAALEVSGPPADVTKAVRELLDGRPTPSPSPLGRMLVARQVRSPLDIARMLAARYPASPIMSYIPALSWSGALRLSQLTGDPQYRDRAVAQMTPFLTGEKPAIAEPFLLTSLAGHQAFFDLAELTGNAQADALARKAADAILGAGPDEIVKYATSWTDDMFMATSVLARAAKRTGEARYADAVARLLTTYATRLQRDGRIFVHAESGPHAWGRGNGFAAFGLMEALTHLPETWAARPQVLDSFRRLMDGMRRHQAPDGAWQQVVDEPGTYREFTVTAMTVAAMARGLRLGWLDRSFDEVVERGWRAVQVRITETGDLVDVCTGTGAGRNATREYYLTRPALTGPDDRGGAMALTAALEMHALRAPR
ncbi:MAG: glycoside hydrolase family 88 protein [Acidobacteria bacterium]|nr:glycoside hydrolase family 88 protein [Acidobacteriota bacterium]